MVLARYPFLYLVMLVVVLLGGCAWRTGRSEDYLGPVLFRYTSLSDSEAQVIQVKHLGFLGEGGTQWGLSAGLVERTVVAQKSERAGESCTPLKACRWSAPFSLLSSVTPEHWNLSLLYLHAEGTAQPLLVRRVLYGAAILLGSEANSLSVGAVSRTQLNPPPDAFTRLHFDASRPLQTQVAVWCTASGQDLPDSDIFQGENLKND